MMNVWRSAPMLFPFVLLVWVSLVAAGASEGEKKPVFPTPLGYVSDYADLIEPDGQRRIREVCKELEDRYRYRNDRRDHRDSQSSLGMHGTMRRACIRNGTLARPNKSGECYCSLRRKSDKPWLYSDGLCSRWIGKPQLDELSTQYLIPMFQNARYGESLSRMAVGLASASGSAIQAAAQTKRSSSAGFWMNVAVVFAMLFVLWRFTRPERRHPFQRWRRGGYWSTGQGGFGGNFGGFGGRHERAGVIVTYAEDQGNPFYLPFNPSLQRRGRERRRWKLSAE